MPKRDDLMRALQSGQDPYYAAIKASPAYQSTLQKIKDTRPEKNWIQSPIGLPKFTSDDFEKSLANYQAKYGSSINVPGFEDVIHWRPRAIISNEDMAAHVYAQKRGLPSPLSPDQISTLASKKLRFLRMLQAPETWVQRQAAAVLTATDNAEDALITFSVLGRLARYAAPKALGRLAPIVGWAQVGSDVLNLFNVAGQLTKKAYATKRMLEKNLDNNPFHKKFYAQRTRNLSKTWPGLGEILEIAQTTDQIFGFGLCLGGIMGTVNDVLTKGIEQVAAAAANVAVTAQYPSAYREIWADAINSASIVWNAKDWVDEQTLAQVTIAASHSMEALMPTWLQVESPEFLEILRSAGQSQKPAYRVDTKYLLDAFGVDPDATPQWPMFDAITVDLEDLAYTYAPRIKDNFQTYLNQNQESPGAQIAAQAATDLHATVIQTFSDDHVAQVSQTAIAGTVKDMAISTLLIPQETPQTTIDKLASWIQNYERQHGSQPSIKDIEITGIGLGIKWTNRYPKRLQGKAAELWPQWQAIQDQLNELHLPNFE